MGGAPKQVNSGQASTASSGAFGAAQDSLKIGKGNQDFTNGMMDTFFGANGKPGTMTDMMNPSNLSNANLDPYHKLQYNQAVGQAEKENANQQRNIFDTVSNRGTGFDPGTAFRYGRQAQLDASDSKGRAYADTVGSQHNEALQNFWGATDVAANQANAARSAAVSATGNAGQTYSNIYGTAGQQSRPGIGSQLLGGGMSAGGMLGGAAIMCPAEDALVLTVEGYKAVQSLKKGDRLVQIGMVSAPLALDPIPHHGFPLCLATTITGKGGMMSRTHALVRGDGGFTWAYESLGKKVVTDDGVAVIANCYDGGHGTVYQLITEGDSNHTYCADGIWALE